MQKKECIKGSIASEDHNETSEMTRCDEGHDPSSAKGPEAVPNLDSDSQRNL